MVRNWILGISFFLLLLLSAANADVDLQRKVKDLQGELLKTMTDLESANSAKRAAGERIKVLEKEMTACVTADDRAAVESKLAKVEKELVDATAALQQSQAALVAAQSDASTAQSDAATVRQSLDLRSQELQAATSLRATLEAKVAALEAKVAALEAEVAALEAKVATLEGKLQGAEAEAATLRATLKEEVAAAQKAAEDGKVKTDAEVAEARAQLVAAMEAAKKKEEEWGRREKGAAADASARDKAAQLEMDAVSSKLRAKEAELAKLQAKLADKHGQGESIAAELAQLKVAILPYWLSSRVKGACDWFEGPLASQAKSVYHRAVQAIPRSSDFKAYARTINGTVHALAHEAKDRAVSSYHQLQDKIRDTMDSFEPTRGLASDFAVNVVIGTGLFYFVVILFYVLRLAVRLCRGSPPAKKTSRKSKARREDRSESSITTSTGSDAVKSLQKATSAPAGANASKAVSKKAEGKKSGK